eukprot:1132168-Alexandrium_andersonii.AAC.1
MASSHFRRPRPASVLWWRPGLGLTGKTLLRKSWLMVNATPNFCERHFEISMEPPLAACVLLVL